MPRRVLASSTATTCRVTHPLNIRAQEAADRIAKESKGRVEIKIFPNNQLGGDTDMLAQVRSGGIDFFTPSALVIATLVPVAAINAVGFAFSDYNQVWGAMDGKLGAHVRAAIAKVAPLRLREDVGQRLPPDDHQQRRRSTTRQGHGRPEDPRAGEPAVDLDVQGPGRRADQPAVQRGLLGAADQDRRRAGEPAADHPGRQAVRGAEVLLADQPHLGRLLVHRQRPRLGRACPPTCKTIVARAINDAGMQQREDIEAQRDGAGRPAGQGPGLQPADRRQLPRQAARGRLLRRVEGRFGAEAWALLEGTVGKLA